MRIVTAREQVEMLEPWMRSAVSQSDLMDYRWERDRQERAREMITGGNPEDEEDWKARNKPLITLKDWMKGQKGRDTPEPMDPNFTYTAPPGSDYEPPW